MLLELSRLPSKFIYANYIAADPSTHAVLGVGLQPIDCWDRGFIFL
jgi:hypothetical protein